MTYLNYLLKLFFLSTLLYLVSSSSPINPTQIKTINNSNFTIKRGINISHWLSQTNKNEAERKKYFSEQDMELIASLGYDHIRLPIDEKNMWDEKGMKLPLAFQSLHNAIHWAKNNKLKIIVDLHIVRSHFFNNKYNPLWDDATEKKKFVNLWKQLSLELIKYPNNLLAYEILNEPVANDHENWNELIDVTLKEIRSNEPARKVVIGSNKWQSVDTFNFLKIPENDPNIILSFHFYSPHVFTHYKAPWSKKIGFYEGSVQYPGIPINKKNLIGFSEEQITNLSEDNFFYSKEVFQTKIQEPLRIAKKYNLQLYCGEFGSLPTTPNKDRMQWYADAKSVFEENNIAWANWDYQGSFGVLNPKTSVINRELIKILMKNN